MSLMSTEALPTVTIVFLVYNRREELRESLERMREDSDYPRELVDVIVVDNASEDGAGDMVERDFPDVRLIRRTVNCGVSGWNDGFAVATGEWVLVLDDDCYLPPDGLRRAIELARANDSDLVSFGVTSDVEDGYRFDHRYRTGLFTFWGCAVLVRREVLERIGGYDPEIFVWANELEFMLRFFDAGYRHLHAPEIIAVHMKKIEGTWEGSLGNRPYMVNQRHFAYIAAKHLRLRDALETLLALVVGAARHGLLYNRRALGGVRQSLEGFAHGLRFRDPVKDARISRLYRRSFESFASPWWMSRPLPEMVASRVAAPVRRALGRPQPPAHPGRREDYLLRNAAYYPDVTSTLDMRNGAQPQPARRPAVAR
jgi:GT2 family glycosyltransferase